MTPTEKIDEAIRMLREAQDEIPAGPINSPEDNAVFDIGFAINTARGAKKRLEIIEERNRERA